jgi:hypothetical protein
MRSSCAKTFMYLLHFAVQCFIIFFNFNNICVSFPSNFLHKNYSYLMKYWSYLNY